MPQEKPLEAQEKSLEAMSGVCKGNKHMDLIFLKTEISNGVAEGLTIHSVDI